VLFLLSAATPAVCADFSIAVVGVSADRGRDIEEYIRRTLRGIPEIQVVEVKREVLEKYYKGRKIPYPFPTKLLSAVGKEMGVDYVISGHDGFEFVKRLSVFTQENEFLVLRLIDVKDQNDLAWIVNRIPNKKRHTAGMIYDLISRLADKYPFLAVYPIRDSIVDPRDGQTYQTLRVKDQVFFAENLNFDAGQGSYCYDDDPNNCEKYGRLYTWEIAMAGDSSSNEIPSGVQGLCPEGWHFPSLAELAKLGGNLLVYPPMDKENEAYSFYISPRYRDKYWSGNLVYSMPDVGGGYRTSAGKYKNLNSLDDWWTASSGRVEGGGEKNKVIEVVSDSLAKKKTSLGHIIDPSRYSSDVFKAYHDNKKAAYPVRCIMNQRDNDVPHN